MTQHKRSKKRSRAPRKDRSRRTPPLSRATAGILTDEESQRQRIEKLKREAAELAGGEMISWESEALSLDLREQFWRNVVSFESGAGDDESYFVPIELLKDAGVEFPPAEELGDEALTRKLWEVIRAMARRRWYLVHTDHLSDRKLYGLLVEDLLAEETLSAPPEANLILDVLGGCSPEDIATALKYYYDENERRDWVKSFPEDKIPEAEDLPYDRDRHLPHGWGPPAGSEGFDM